MAPGALDRRARLLARVEHEWAALLGTMHGLDDACCLQAGVVGQWSLRDLLVHITSWEEEALKAIPIILEGRRLPRYSQLYGGIDAFNAQVQTDREALTLTQVRAETKIVHQRLLSCLESLTEEALTSGGRLARRLKQDTYAHYSEHATHVADWRRLEDL